MKSKRTTPYYIYSAALTLLLALALMACGHGHQQRLLQLEELERQNRADSLMTNDSLALALTQYFDRHGTPNEQMRAHYMLGRTYYDRGELPQALDAYHEAAARADTTAQDCDYRTLCRVHAQTAEILYSQDLFQDALANIDEAVSLAYEAQDTLAALQNFAQKPSAYYGLHATDTAVILSLLAAKRYAEHGYKAHSAAMLGYTAFILLERGDTSGVSAYLNTYEKESGFFRKGNEVEPGREVYYYAKGLYYMAKGELVTAGKMFRKELRDGKDNNNQNLGAWGLAQLFSKTQQPDSAAKYALYAYKMNDSLRMEKVTGLVKMQQDNYKYERLKRIAIEKSRQAQEKSKTIRSLSMFLFALVAVCAYVVSTVLRKRKKMERSYASNVLLLSQVKYERDCLMSHELEYQKEIAKKTKTISNLSSKIEEYENKSADKLLALNTKDAELCATDEYKLFVAYSIVGEKPQDGDWRKLLLVISQKMPEFHKFLLGAKGKLNESEFKVCILTRLKLKPKAIAYMLGVTPSYISKCRVRMLHDLFHRAGKPNEFDAEICRFA